MKITDLKLKYKVIPYIIPILLINQLVSPRKVWMILLVGLVTALGISYYWALSLKTKLSLSREMRFGWSQVGDHLQERFNLDNNGWAPAITQLVRRIYIRATPWEYLKSRLNIQLQPI
jgi:hypothetical protein